MSSLNDGDFDFGRRMGSGEFKENYSGISNLDKLKSKILEGQVQIHRIPKRSGFGNESLVTFTDQEGARTTVKAHEVAKALKRDRKELKGGTLEENGDKYDILKGIATKLKEEFPDSSKKPSIFSKQSSRLKIIKETLKLPSFPTSQKSQEITKEEAPSRSNSERSVKEEVKVEKPETPVKTEKTRKVKVAKTKVHHSKTTTKVEEVVTPLKKEPSKRKEEAFVTSVSSSEEEQETKKTEDTSQALTIIKAKTPPKVKETKKESLPSKLRLYTQFTKTSASPIRIQVPQSVFEQVKKIVPQTMQKQAQSPIGTSEKKQLTHEEEPPVQEAVPSSQSLELEDVSSTSIEIIEKSLSLEDIDLSAFNNQSVIKESFAKHLKAHPERAPVFLENMQANLSSILNQNTKKMNITDKDKLFFILASKWEKSPLIKNNNNELNYSTEAINAFKKWDEANEGISGENFQIFQKEGGDGFNLLQGRKYFDLDQLETIKSNLQLLRDNRNGSFIKDNLVISDWKEEEIQNLIKHIENEKVENIALSGTHLIQVGNTSLQSAVRSYKQEIVNNFKDVFNNKLSKENETEIRKALEGKSAGELQNIQKNLEASSSLKKVEPSTVNFAQVIAQFNKK